MDKNKTLKRLRNVEGHVHGIAGMVEEDAYCIDVIRQIQAAQGALAKVASTILDEHLHNCLTTAVRGDDPQEREKVLAEVADLYSMTVR
ncbi:MAG: metal-sensitive transcriptional regulator [Anaerolineales bacterium]